MMNQEHNACIGPKQFLRLTDLLADFLARPCHNTDTVTTLRRTPIYPSITLNGCLPTVNGVSYCSWADALAAKAAGVTYLTLDLFGGEVA
jgi:hypothetical protein